MEEIGDFRDIKSTVILSGIRKEIKVALEDSTGDEHNFNSSF